jgi:hypothetical protein
MERDGWSTTGAAAGRRNQSGRPARILVVYIRDYNGRQIRLVPTGGGGFTVRPAGPGSAGPDSASPSDAPLRPSLRERATVVAAAARSYIRYRVNSSGRPGGAWLKICSLVSIIS